MTLIEELLRRHSCSPSPPGIKWAKEKWSDPAAIVERIEQCRRNSRDGKGKGSMCAILGACLIQAQEQNNNSNRLAKDNLQKQLEVNCLKVELKCERERKCLLEQKTEIMLAQAKTPPSIAQIRQ